MRAGHFVTFLGGLALTASSFTGTLAGQNFFTRYFRNQKTERVRTPANRIEGERRGGKVYLSQQQAIEMALRHNLDVNILRQDHLYNRWSVKRKRAFYDPRLTMNFNWDRNTTPSASVLQGGTSVTNIATRYDFGYHQSFSTGTSLEFNFNGLRSRSTSFFSSLVPAINTSFELLLRQNLLKGFGRTEREYDIKIARNRLDISRQEFRRQAAAIITRVLDRYWELEFALEDIQVKEKALEWAKTVLKQNRARFQVGTAARLQVVQSEAEVASRKVALVRSRFHYRQAQDELVDLITSYPDPREFPGEIVPADPVRTPPPVTDSFKALQARALENRPELEQAAVETHNEEINLQRSRDHLRPKLNLLAGYRQFGLGGRTVIRDFSRGFTNAPVVGIIPGGLGGSLSQLFSSDFYGYVAGLDLELPIGNRDARAENAQAQIALRRSRMRHRRLRQQVSLELREALDRVRSTRAGLEEAEAAVRAARERLEAEKARFQVGVGTTRELIEAQRDLLAAESVRIRTQTDLIKSHQLLDQATGRVFERHHIQLADALTTNVQ